MSVLIWFCNEAYISHHIFGLRKNFASIVRMILVAKQEKTNFMDIQSNLIFDQVRGQSPG